MQGSNAMIPCNDETVYEGEIVSITDLGMFVKISGGEEGLIHYSKLPGKPEAGTLGNHFRIGQLINVKREALNRHGVLRLKCAE